MADTVLLSKVIGLFATIAGIAMLLRSRDLAEVVAAFARERALRVLISAAELLAGLFLVVMHRDWSSGPAILISLAGWVAVIESSAYFLLPDSVIGPFLRLFTRSPVIFGTGLIALLLGLYLAAYGFRLA